MVAAILSLVLYLVVRVVAYRAAETSQDNILGASVTAIADELRPEHGGIAIDIPYSSLSMLGALSDDSVFYRVATNGQTITGYDDLPASNDALTNDTPVFYRTNYRGNSVRVAALSRTITVDSKPLEVLVLVAQTQRGQEAIIARISITAAAVGIGFFILAGLLSWLAAHAALRPIERVTLALTRRGPHDLSPLKTPPPSELAPLVSAVNVFMELLNAAMLRTEDFLAEAAHRVRTPLATVRTQSEIAMRRTDDEETRAALRAVIRAVDESSRSAGQLIDHAMVNFRSGKLSQEVLDVNEVTRDVMEGLKATADLKDIEMIFDACRERTVVTGDTILLHGALRNLLDNAIKYSPDESRINIDVQNVDSSSVRVRICDQGRGLAGASHRQLAKRFSRGRNVGDIVGSGLGLTIAADVARVHKGHVSLEANGEKGTCASLVLPLS